jgi:hypothetical protein
MTEVVALTALLGVVAAVALVVGRPFRGTVDCQGVNIESEADTLPGTRPRGGKGRKRKNP